MKKFEDCSSVLNDCIHALKKHSKDDRLLTKIEGDYAQFKKFLEEKKKELVESKIEDA